jgi:hypothetical protein
MRPDISTAEVKQYLSLGTRHVIQKLPQDFAC